MFVDVVAANRPTTICFFFFIACLTFNSRATIRRLPSIFFFDAAVRTLFTLVLSFLKLDLIVPHLSD